MTFQNIFQLSHSLIFGSRQYLNSCLQIPNLFTHNEHSFKNKKMQIRIYLLVVAYEVGTPFEQSGFDRAGLAGSYVVDMVTERKQSK